MTDSKNFTKAMRDYGKTLETLFPRNGSQAHNSFAQWRHSAQLARDILMQEFEENAKAKAEIDKTYSPNYAADRKAEIDKNYAQLVQSGVDIMKKDLTGVSDAKRKAFHDSMKAPSPDQVALLQVLSMRSDIDSDELSYFADSMTNNLVALRCLADIAGKHNIPFPKMLTPTELESNLAEIDKVADSYLSVIGEPLGNLTYLQRLFWTTSDPFRESPVFDAVDSPCFLQDDAVTSKSPATKKTSEKQEKPNQNFITRLTVNGDEYPDVICRQFGITREQLSNANKGLNIDHLPAGTTINIPGILQSSESGTGHISESTHSMEVVVADA